MSENQSFKLSIKDGNQSVGGRGGEKNFHRGPNLLPAALGVYVVNI